MPAHNFHLEVFVSLMKQTGEMYLGARCGAHIQIKLSLMEQRKEKRG